MSEKKVKYYQAAGGVVLNDGGQVLLLRREVWREGELREEIRLPKGHIEPGETAAEAALREVCEESGYCHLEILADLGERRTVFGYKGKYVIRDERYFLMGLTQPHRQKPHHPHPHSEEALFRPLWAESLAQAEALLTFESEKAFIRRAEALVQKEQAS